MQFRCNLFLMVLTNELDHNSARKWFQKIFRRNKRILGEKSSLIIWNRLEMIPIFWNKLLLVTKVKLKVKVWNDSLQPKKAQMRKSEIKSMQICFFDSQAPTKSTLTERFLKDHTSRANNYWVLNKGFLLLPNLFNRRTWVLLGPIRPQNMSFLDILMAVIDQLKTIRGSRVPILL